MDQLTTSVLGLLLRRLWVPPSQGAAVKLSYLPEFAALLSAHVRLICAEPSRLDADVVGQIYVAARDRSNRWMQEINRTSESDAFSPESLLARRHPLVDMAERILLNDILVRTWAGIMVSVDKVNEQATLGAIARNLHLGQMVLRHRVISRVLASNAVTSEETAHVNGVREKVERWTDMLMGQLEKSVRAQFAFQPDRADDFANTYSRDNKTGADSHVWKLVLTGVRSAFGRDIPDSSLVSADDRNLIMTILAGLSPAVTRLTRDELGPRVGTLQL